MVAVDTQNKHRKWMRGLARVFISFGTLGLGILTILTLLAPQGMVSLETTVAPIIFSIIILITAIMAWNASRLGAIMLLLLVLSSFLDLGTMSIGTVALFSVLIVLATMLLWHTFHYHKAAKRLSSPIAGRAWIRWAGLAALTPFMLAIIVGSLGYVGAISTKVEAARDIPYEHLVWMHENDLLESDERVLFFYSEGIFSIEEGGNILTNKYVGAWQKDDDGLNDYWQRLGEICRIETVIEGSPLEDALYKIYGPDEDSWFHILLSIEDDGHKRFLRRMNVMNERRMHPVVKNACDTSKALDRVELAKANGIEQSLVTASSVNDDQKEWLYDQGYLTRDEEIISFYSYGEYDISPGGSLLTDKYFGGWYDKGGSVQGNWAKLEEICSLERVDPSDDSDTPLFLMNYGKEDWFRFQLPAEASETLIPNILEQVAERQTDDNKAVCEARFESTKPDAA